jgi:hypothetical protein
MDTSSDRDHDYAVWGPFASVDAARATCGSLPSPTDCSYSRSATEHPGIPRVVSGEVYVVLLTNYARVTQALNAELGATNTAALSCAAVAVEQQKLENKQAGACDAAALERRAEQISSICCTGGRCNMGGITACTEDCAAVLLPFWDMCSGAFEGSSPDLAGMQQVLEAAVVTCSTGPPCSDFYEISVNCPVHRVDGIVPAMCDDPTQPEDDQCAVVFTAWYERCFADLTLLDDIPGGRQQLTEFYQLCGGLKTIEQPPPPPPPPPPSPPEGCSTSPCRNGGDCSNLANGEFTCNCASGFSGDSCLDSDPPPPPTDACHPSPCMHHGREQGTCYANGASHLCVCTGAYTGTNCEVSPVPPPPPNPCVAAPCLNGGACAVADSGGGHRRVQAAPVAFTCSCPAGFSGHLCETADPPPPPPPPIRCIPDGRPGGGSVGGRRCTCGCCGYRYHCCNGCG